MVACPYCHAMVTRSRAVVERATFREARARLEAVAWAACQAGARSLHGGGLRYRLLALLGAGEQTDVYLAERSGPLPERVTLKLARQPGPTGRLAAEAATLVALQDSTVNGAAYFTQRLPQVVAYGMTEGTPGDEHEMLLLRHPAGYWGSLADVLHQAPTGLDPRHAVWIWRRVLEVLAFVHDSGWTHGDLAPEHWLVHPRDHGVLMVGWRQARPVTDAAAIVRDLMQSAWSVRALLAGGADLPALAGEVPPPLADLLRRCSEDAGFCEQYGARGIEQQLTGAAQAAFGPPQFIPFNPTAATYR
jgi:serine/threonine protein kinase